MKTLSFRKTTLSLVAGLTLTLGLVNCGGGGSTSTTVASDTTNSYTGAGSQWNNSINDTAKTFTITHQPEANESIDFTINGSFEELDSGFKKLTVSTSTGTNAPSVGSVGYGLEIPGYAFFLQPEESSGELITMVQGGECPTQDLSGNWVTVKNLHDVNTSTNVGTPADVSSATQDSFGTFNWDLANSKLNLPLKYALSNPTVDLNSSESVDINCTNGVAQIPGVTMYLTSNGGVIVHAEHDSGSGNGTTDETVITAFSSETLTAKSDFDGNYAGILLSSDVSSASSVEALSMVCQSGVCSGDIIDPSTNSPIVAAGSATLNLTGNINSPSAGFISGTITTKDGIGNMTCMVDTNAASTGKNLMSIPKRKIPLRTPLSRYVNYCSYHVYPLTEKAR